MITVLESLNEILEEIRRNRAQILEDFTRAYIAETGLPPTQIELCEQRDGAMTRWFFRKREPTES